MLTLEDAVAITKPHNDKLIAEGKVARLERENRRLRSRLKIIADRRADLAAASKNDYDAGYTLATEMCCDIADEALAGEP